MPSGPSTSDEDPHGDPRAAELTALSASFSDVFAIAGSSRLSLVYVAFGRRGVERRPAVRIGIHLISALRGRLRPLRGRRRSRRWGRPSPVPAGPGVGDQDRLVLAQPAPRRRTRACSASASFSKLPTTSTIGTLLPRAFQTEGPGGTPREALLSSPLMETLRREGARGVPKAPRNRRCWMVGRRWKRGALSPGGPAAPAPPGGRPRVEMITAVGCGAPAEGVARGAVGCGGTSPPGHGWVAGRRWAGVGRGPPPPAWPAPGPASRAPGLRRAGRHFRRRGRRRRSLGPRLLGRGRCAGAGAWPSPRACPASRWSPGPAPPPPPEVPTARPELAPASTLTLTPGTAGRSTVTSSSTSTSSSPAPARTIVRPAARACCALALHLCPPLSSPPRRPRRPACGGSRAGPARSDRSPSAVTSLRPPGPRK